MSSHPSAAGAGGGGDRWLPWLLALTALLPDLGAAIPGRSYYFRDFSVTFYPLRLFAAREWAAGRWPLWNPYIHEGSFALPVLYPLDLLHVLWPSPAAVSWLLTLQLPLAALCGYWLARDLKASPLGAFVAGSVYAMGGLCLSSLNLYVFLQALALAPLVVLTFRRAAARGGRWVPAAGLALGLSLTTLALEFVLQGLTLGLALGLAASRGRAGFGRMATAVLVGLLLAGVPVALVGGMLAETVRGVGFPPEVALGNEAHPLSLLQALIPGLFGSLSSPVESWWGGHFFTKGFPYFLSLYVGPHALALAWTGLPAIARRRRWILLAGAGLGLWYALGARGGLAPLVTSLPVFRSFRFPSKALLLPHLAVSLFAGLGAERLSRGEGWGRYGRAAGAAAALALALAGVVLAFPDPVGTWAHIEPSFRAALGQALTVGCLRVVIVALLGVGLAVAVGKGWMRARPATALVMVVLVLDIAQAGAGLNPQTTPRFFDPLPEMAAEGLNRLEGGRVFTYGLDYSPAFLRFLNQGSAGRGLVSFFINRQLLAPYNNILDEVESPEAKDLTSFVLRPPEFTSEEYAPAGVAGILPRLRNAAVARVLSLDPLEHPELKLRAAVPVGTPDLRLFVYEVDRPWSRAYFACRVLPALGPDQAAGVPYGAGFDPSRDVALEEPREAMCGKGTVRRVSIVPGEERYRTESDGPGYLVTRDSFARDWFATVDGRGVPLLRANGKHRAVPVPGGSHDVELRYRPRGLFPGLAGTGLGVLAVTLLWVRGRDPRGAADD
jgi:hypothetical protein